jgi:hypothetical protein
VSPPKIPIRIAASRARERVGGYAARLNTATAQVTGTARRWLLSWLLTRTWLSW